MLSIIQPSRDALDNKAVTSQSLLINQFFLLYSQWWQFPRSQTISLDELQEVFGWRFCISNPALGNGLTVLNTSRQECSCTHKHMITSTDTHTLFMVLNIHTHILTLHHVHGSDTDLWKTPQMDISFWINTVKWLFSSFIVRLLFMTVINVSKTFKPVDLEYIFPVCVCDGCVSFSLLTAPSVQDITKQTTQTTRAPNKKNNSKNHHYTIIENNDHNSKIIIIIITERNSSKDWCFLKWSRFSTVSSVRIQSAAIYLHKANFLE